MLIGLAVLARAHHVVPRGGVTILAQMSAGAFGTGWAFYVSNIAVALVLALAANTSFGGLPVLMSLLARDHRLPHLFYLRAERPVYRHGIIALAVAALLLLIAVNAETGRLIPLYAIGVFLGFTISQVGLVHHWRKARPPKWRARATLNSVGAVMTAVAVIVFLASKFLEGAWVVVIAIPLLMSLFAHTETYYAQAARDLKLGKTPPHPKKRESVVIVPCSTVNLLTEKAVSAALSLGETVVAVAVAGDDAECADDKTRVGRVGPRDPDRGATRPPAVADPDGAALHPVGRERERHDHRPHPADHPEGATTRDPSQPARPATRDRAEGANGRRHRDAAVPHQALGRAGRALRPARGWRGGRRRAGAAPTACESRAG